MGAEIQLEDVSLKFRVYRNPSPALKEHVVSILQPKAQDDKFFEFYSLKDISLRIKHGERVGIIGLNGAGKSTLLKSIVGIYPPTTGAIRIRGKVVPLIEVGTGFDLEMSGRANIHLNGALLARGRDEMMALEQQIIEFSELHDFIDMPLKYYSSGMAGRLAFSIATMVEPEILVVDEIFATGDAQFVGKAMGRMKDLIDKSHIVVMVSHSMDHIRSICNRVLVMDHGHIVNDGPTDEMIQYYYSEIVGQTELKPAAQHDDSANAEEAGKAAFDRDGFVSVPALKPAELNELSQLWSQTAPTDRGSYFLTALDSNVARRKYVHECVKTIIEPHIEKNFPGYRICMAYFEFLKADARSNGVQIHQKITLTEQLVDKALTICIPLMDLDESSGCPTVVDGSHKWISHINSIPRNSNPFNVTQIEKEMAHPVPLRAGHMLVCDHALLAGLSANISDKDRIAVCCTLLPIDVKAKVYSFNPIDPTKLRIFELSDAALLNLDLVNGIPAPYDEQTKYVGEMDNTVAQLTLEQIREKNMDLAII